MDTIVKSQWITSEHVRKQNEIESATSIGSVLTDNCPARASMIMPDTVKAGTDAGVPGWLGSWPGSFQLE